MSTNIIVCKTGSEMSLICWSNLVDLRLKIIGFGSHGHVRHVHYVRKLWKWELVRFLESEIEKWLVPHEANNSTELVAFSKFLIYNRMFPSQHLPAPNQHSQCLTETVFEQVPGKRENGLPGRRYTPSSEKKFSDEKLRVWKTGFLNFLP